MGELGRATAFLRGAAFSCTDLAVSVRSVSRQARQPEESPRGDSQPVIYLLWGRHLRVLPGAAPSGVGQRAPGACGRAEQHPATQLRHREPQDAAQGGEGGREQGSLRPLGHRQRRDRAPRSHAAVSGGRSPSPGARATARCHRRLLWEASPALSTGRALAQSRLLVKRLVYERSGVLLDAAGSSEGPIDRPSLSPGISSPTATNAPLVRRGSLRRAPRRGSVRKARPSALRGYCLQALSPAQLRVAAC